MKDFSDPQNVKPTPAPVKSWKAQAETCTTQDPLLRKLWSQPDWMQFKLRSKTYLQNKIKAIGAPPLFELVWFESFKGTHEELMHICNSKKSFVSKAMAKYGNDMPQLFVVTLIIPGSPLVATVQYFARTKSSTTEEPTEAEKLWKRFLNSDDAFRSSRFKLIPTIVDGPWVIRKSVGSTPCIIGKAIKTTYYQAPKYLEVHVDISSDTIAKHITSLCRSQSTNFTVDMGFLVEGQTEEELPEALLGCVRSARQAKRLAKEREAEAHNSEEEVESDEELEEKRPANMGFAFLADSDSESDDSEEEEEEEEDVEPVAVAPEPHKGKNKKNKKKGKKDEEQESVDDILDALAAEADNLSVDEATSIRNEQEQSLFGVQLKFANADKEMKRIFGVKEGGPSNNRKRGDPRSAARATTKKVMMVSPLDEWPRPPTFVGGGIRWTRSNKPKGAGWNSLCNYYEITWSIAYKKLQEEFELLQRTHDPNLIGHFLQRYPYHIDALLTMSEVFQHHGQMDHASDCIKRCMYVLELAWADQFDVSKGNCRMDIQTEHNAGFFRALFLLMKQVGRRGCMRSAFETAKLLLSLDPQGDPMNVLLAIDYYALTSRQCEFLIDLFDSKTPAVDRLASDDVKSKTKPGKKTSVGIEALPNLQFSLALAHFFLGNETEAKDKLAVALLKFPTVLKPLLEKIAANPSSSSWQPILSSRVFANARNVDGEHSVLQHLLDIYVTRNHSIWKVNDAQSFLLRSAQHALASPALVSANPQVLELPQCLHKYLRALSADYSDEITTLPADHPMLQPPQLQNGQPLDAEALAALAQAQQEFEAGNLPADANPLLLFLQTLLPWNHVQGAAQQQPPQ
ncbi:hypothetical protein DVH05_026532 [Phytophthora capsici]|nr:hypothetical protein DVH05_026532 [Phytophthora capsici]